MPLIRAALKETGLTAQDIDAVAYKIRRTGLVGALDDPGQQSAVRWRFLQMSRRGQFTHMEGHLLAPMLEEHQPEFPFVAR